MKHFFSLPALSQRNKKHPLKLTLYFLPLLLLILSMACGTTSATQSGNNNHQSTISLTAAPDKRTESTNTTSPEGTLHEIENQNLTMKNQFIQGANFGYLNDVDFNEFAVGLYDVNNPSCGSPGVIDEYQQEEEILLRLEYGTPVVPQWIKLYGNINPSEIKRIELLNSISGLGVMLDKTNSTLQQFDSPGGACLNRNEISVHSELEADTILIEFNQASAVSQIAAVELLGSLANYWEPPVYWRVPLPGTPVDIAIGQHGLVYVAVEPNQLFAYDVEGNQLREYAVPEQSEITAIACDPFGNLLIQDNSFDWFIMLSPEGDQLSTGVVTDYYWADVNPINGNLYLMNNDEISIYTTDTADLISHYTFNEMAEYSALTFSQQGELFVLGNAQWEPEITQLNPETFEELDANPLRMCNQMELTARDLALDTNSNQYVLFTVNCAQIAIHEYDANGTLIKRFGSLDIEVDEWAEGTFLDPHAITVSPDGRFLLVADGYDEKSYLTAYLMEIN